MPARVISHSFVIHFCVFGLDLPPPFQFIPKFTEVHAIRLSMFWRSTVFRSIKTITRSVLIKSCFPLYALFPAKQRGKRNNGLGIGL